MCMHFTLPAGPHMDPIWFCSASSSVTCCLHVICHTILRPPLWPSLSWQLHYQHSSPNVPFIPPFHMSKPSQSHLSCFIPKPSNLGWSSNLVISIASSILPPPAVPPFHQCHRCQAVQHGWSHYHRIHLPSHWYPSVTNNSWHILCSIFSIHCLHLPEHFHLCTHLNTV